MATFRLKRGNTTTNDGFTGAAGEPTVDTEDNYRPRIHDGTTPGGRKLAFLSEAGGGGATLDTDGTFAANSDTVAPSQKAAKTYVDSKSVDVTVASGEKVLTVTSAGVQKTYDIAELIVASTSLTAADFSSGSATVTGTPGQKAYDSNYVYECVTTNSWKRTPIGLNSVDIYAGTIDDSGGLKTSTELSAAFPSIVTCQRVYGSAGIYEKKAANWVYFAHTTV